MTAFVRINVMMNLFILHLSDYRNSMQSIKNQGKNTLTAMVFFVIIKVLMNLYLTIYKKATSVSEKKKCTKNYIIAMDDIVVSALIEKKIQ